MKPNFIAPPPRIVHSAEMANEAERGSLSVPPGTSTHAEMWSNGDGKVHCSPGYRVAVAAPGRLCLVRDGDQQPMTPVVAQLEANGECQLGALQAAAAEATDQFLENSIPRFFTKQTNPSRYPHTCPRCQGPAYVGAVEVDCARGCK